jgi:hypothetical protein
MVLIINSFKKFAFFVNIEKKAAPFTEAAFYVFAISN